MLENRYR